MSAPVLRNKDEVACRKAWCAICCWAGFVLNHPQRCKAPDLPGRCKVQFTIKVTGSGQVGVHCPALLPVDVFWHPLPLHRVLPTQARGRKVSADLIWHSKKRVEIPQYRHHLSFRKFPEYFTGQKCCNIFVKVSKNYLRKPKKNIHNKQQSLLKRAGRSFQQTWSDL